MPVSSESMEVKYRKKSGKKVRKPKIVDGDESAIKLIARPSKDETVEIIEPLATNQKGVNLSEDDMQLDQVMEDTVECEKLIQEYTGKVDKATHHVRALTERVVAGELNIKKGMDFLHSKLHANLSYCISTAVLMLMKAEGESIKGNDIVKELVRLRGYIEKMRPMESKLKYQIDKLVKMSEQVGGNSEEEANNALSYRPQLSSLVSRDEDSKSLAGRSKGDQDEGDEDDDEDKTGVYVPPRITAMPFADDFAGDKKEKDKMRDLNKLRDSEVYRELQEELTEDPREIKDYSRLLDTEVTNKKEQMDKLRFEEDNYKRLNDVKKKNKTTKFVKSELDSITDFGGLGALARRSKRKTVDEDEEPGAFKKKRMLKDYQKAEKGKMKGKRRGGGSFKKGRN